MNDNRKIAAMIGGLLTVLICIGILYWISDSSPQVQHYATNMDGFDYTFDSESKRIVKIHLTQPNGTIVTISRDIVTSIVVSVGAPESTSTPIDMCTTYHLSDC